MHPALTQVVSHLSYDDRLVADPCAAERTSHGVAPGVVTELVPHDLNRAASPEEVDAVAGSSPTSSDARWTDPHDRPAPGPARSKPTSWWWPRSTPR
jgi:hypothetical protein